MSRIVIACDSFKGSLTSGEAAEAIAEGIRAACPDCGITAIPVADGGEGTLDAVQKAVNGKWMTTQTFDPLMRRTEAPWLMIERDGTKTAVIELASSSGLTLLGQDELNPMMTTTYGTGVIVREAISHGCKDIVLTLGGSATNDAGAGLLAAIGINFWHDDEIVSIPCGKDLEGITRITYTNIYRGTKQAHFTLACDVDTPFCGKQGAAWIFARQKGATDEMIDVLDKGLEHFAAIAKEYTGKDIAQIPGSGAAGGTAGGLLAFTDARIISGAEMVLDLAGFDEAINGASLVITGEGRIDAQTMKGKLPSIVAARAAAHGIPVIAVCGKCGKDIDAEMLPFKVLETCPKDMDTAFAMQKRQAKTNIITAVATYISSTLPDND